MAINPISVEKQENVSEHISSLKRRIEKGEKLIIETAEEVIDKILYLKCKELKLKGHINIYEEDVWKNELYKDCFVKDSRIVFFTSKKYINILIEKYAQNGWMVEYKSFLGFNKYFKFTPLPKSSLELKKNKFSNLDID